MNGSGIGRFGAGNEVLGYRVEGYLVEDFFPQCSGGLALKGVESCCTWGANNDMVEEFNVFGYSSEFLGLAGQVGLESYCALSLLVGAKSLTHSPSIP